MVEFGIIEFGQFSELRPLVEAYVKELMHMPENRASIGQVENYLKTRFTFDDPDKTIIWAILQDRPVGFAMVRFDCINKIGFIHDFYVAPEVRRKGHGSDMLRWIFNYAQKFKIEHIDLNVDIKNSIAQLFWEDQGFSLIQYRYRQKLSGSSDQL